MGLTTMASMLLALWAVLMTFAVAPLPDTNLSFLPPVNLTIQVIGIAQVLLRWAPDPAQEGRGEMLRYHVRVLTPSLQEADELETPHTESKHQVALHLGLSACVRTVLWAPVTSQPASHWVTAALEAPPGAPGSSAVNLTCSTVVWADEAGHPGPPPLRVALQCSWQAGGAAPLGLQYFLRYRYESITQECHSYEQDTLGRNVGCHVPRVPLGPKIRGKLAVQVTGSSPRGAAQPREQLFDLKAMERVNPPGNLTASVQGYQLAVGWRTPLSAFPPHCFLYEVRVRNPRTGLLQTEQLSDTAFTLRTDGVSWYSVSVRAAVSTACGSAGSWGAWSQPVLVGHDELPALGGWLQAVAVAGAGLSVLLLSLLCWLCPLRAKLLPPVPAPKRSVAEFLVAVGKEAGPGAGAQEAAGAGGQWEPRLDPLDDSGL